MIGAKIKKTVLGHFVDNVVKKRGDEVSSIYVFGSYVKGEGKGESDIDVLIFARNPEKVEDTVWESAVEVYEKFKKSIEPIVYPSSLEKKPNSYFLSQVIRYGVRIF